MKNARKIAIMFIITAFIIIFIQKFHVIKENLYYNLKTYISGHKKVEKLELKLTDSSDDWNFPKRSLQNYESILEERYALFQDYLRKSIGIIREYQYGIPADCYREEFGYIYIEDIFTKKFYFENNDKIPTFFGINVTTDYVDSDEIPEIFVGKHPLNIHNSNNYIILSTQTSDKKIQKVSEHNAIVIDNGKMKFFHFHLVHLDLYY